MSGGARQERKTQIARRGHGSAARWHWLRACSDSHATGWLGRSKVIDVIPRSISCKLKLWHTISVLSKSPVEVGWQVCIENILFSCKYWNIILCFFVSYYAGLPWICVIRLDRPLIFPFVCWGWSFITLLYGYFHYLLYIIAPYCWPFDSTFLPPLLFLDLSSHNPHILWNSSISLWAVKNLYCRNEK